MSDILSVTGVVAADPKHFVSAAGRPVVSFRLASTERRFDRATSSWVDAGTSWYSVSAFNALAENAAASLRRGDRVVLRGRLRIRDWEKDGRTGTTADIVAESIGHDLLWGTTTFTRVSPASGARQDPPAGGGEEDEGWPVAASASASDPAEGARGAQELVEVPF